MEISDGLRALLHDIDPHVRVEIEEALAAKRILDSRVPEDMATWGLDRWRFANERQSAAIDRLLEQCHQHIEDKRVLRQQISRLDTQVNIRQDVPR